MSEDVAYFLIECGANVNHVSMKTSGYTPVMCAIRYGSDALVTFLLGRIDDINRVTVKTPLTWACAHGRVEIVKTLLKHPKIDVNKCDLIGSTPLH